MIRKTSLILMGAAAGVAATLLVTQPRLVLSAKAAAADTYRQLNLFGDVFERVRADYVEKPDDSKLIEQAINGMLNGLDPHSSYMDPKSFRDMQVQTRGEFGGLGIEVTMEDGLVKVVAPIDDTPAAKAGIQANDIITHLDDEQVQGLTLNQAVEKMRGAVNTKIRLKIMRKGQDKPIEVTIVRDRIIVRAVRMRLEGNDVGFIRITQFNEQTSEGLKKSISDIIAQVPNDKLRGYIIDLRNNPGGLLDQAISVSDTFLERGEIVSTRGRNAEETQRYSADHRAGEWRLGLGVGNRRRRAAGPQARDRARDALLRQGLGADHHPARQQQRRAAAHHRALLHAVGQVDPGQGHRAGHRSAAGRAGRPEGARRHQGRVLAARSPQGAGRRGEDRLAVLHPAGAEERQGAQHGAGAAARYQD
jgi:C-terminal peptidase prc